MSHRRLKIVKSRDTDLPRWRHLEGSSPTPRALVGQPRYEDGREPLNTLPYPNHRGSLVKSAIDYQVSFIRSLDDFVVFLKLMSVLE